MSGYHLVSEISHVPWADPYEVDQDGRLKCPGESITLSGQELEALPIPLVHLSSFLSPPTRGTG